MFYFYIYFVPIFHMHSDEKNTMTFTIPIESHCLLVIFASFSQYIRNDESLAL